MQEGKYDFKKINLSLSCKTDTLPAINVNVLPVIAIELRDNSVSASNFLRLKEVHKALQIFNKTDGLQSLKYPPRAVELQLDVNGPKNDAIMETILHTLRLNGVRFHEEQEAKAVFGLPLDPSVASAPVGNATSVVTPVQPDFASGNKEYLDTHGNEIQKQASLTDDQMKTLGKATKLDDILGIAYDIGVRADGGAFKVYKDAAKSEWGAKQINPW